MSQPGDTGVSVTGNTSRPRSFVIRAMQMNLAYYYSHVAIQGETFTVTQETEGGGGMKECVQRCMSLRVYARQG